MGGTYHARLNVAVDFIEQDTVSVGSFDGVSEISPGKDRSVADQFRASRLLTGLLSRIAILARSPRSNSAVSRGRVGRAAELSWGLLSLRFFVGTLESDLVLALAWHNHVHASSRSVVPAESEVDGYAHEKSPPSEEDTHISPDVRVRVRQALQVVVAIDEVSERGCAAYSRASLRVGVLVLREEVRDQVVVDARYDPVLTVSK
jgi:hypothetical protein